MDAKELRIGNFYQYAGDNGIVYATVKVIKYNEFGLLSNYDGTNFEICQPIKLSQSILIQFGFFKHEGWFKKGNIVLHPVNNEYYRTGTHYGREMCTVKIEHVHQLQNLYFALTGEELTFKSE